MVTARGYGRSQLHRSVSETRQPTMNEVPLLFAECDDATFQRDCVAIILDAAIGDSIDESPVSAQQLSAALCAMRDRFVQMVGGRGKKRVGVAALPELMLVCKHCGQEFTTTVPSAKYCSKKCSNAVSWANYKARQRR